MTKGFSVNGEMAVPEITGEIVSCEDKKEFVESEDKLRFEKQQENNLKIKEAMAEELRKMELPEYIVNEILNIEDEPPF